MLVLCIRFCGANNITEVGASVSAEIKINGNVMVFAQRGKINIPISKTWDQPNCITLPVEFTAGDHETISLNKENLEQNYILEALLFIHREQVC